MSKRSNQRPASDGWPYLDRGFFTYAAIDENDHVMPMQRDRFGDLTAKTLMVTTRPKRMIVACHLQTNAPFSTVAVMNVMPPRDRTDAIIAVAGKMTNLAVLNIDPVEAIGLNPANLRKLRSLAQERNISVSLVLNSDTKPEPAIAAEIDLILSYQRMIHMPIPPEGIDTRLLIPKGKLTLLY